MQKDLTLTIGNTAYGKSLFSKNDYAKGDIIVSCDIISTPYTSIYTIPLSENAYFDTENTYLKYLCHSCEPSCRIKIENGLLQLIALRDIKNGDELTVDYSTFCLRFGDEWTFENRDCLCKMPICRGKVLGFEELSREQKDQILPYCLEYIKEYDQKSQN